LLHIHNWFPLLSPSIITAAAEHGVPVVQTLHNFRMVCANATLYRDGAICRDCVGRKAPVDAALHGCYGGSHAGSAMVTAAFAWHRATRTWGHVSLFIALSEFQRGLLIEGGVDPARTVVKPNFVRDAGGAGRGRGGYALFAGRLTPEKGIRTVLKAWEENAPRMPLKIMGDGPLADEVRARAVRMPGAEYLGQQPPAAVREAMGDASFLVCASESYETFALTIVEAISKGTPVLGANLPPIVEIIRDGETGLLFTPGDACDLAAKANLLVEEVDRYRSMRRSCRSIYEQRYTEPINYRLLMQLYARAGAIAEDSCAASRIMPPEPREPGVAAR
jgi:glycosyltransferase involved in cell wall biosynthesis